MGNLMIHDLDHHSKKGREKSQKWPGHYWKLGPPPLWTTAQLSEKSWSSFTLQQYQVFNYQKKNMLNLIHPSGEILYTLLVWTIHSPDFGVPTATRDGKTFYSSANLFGENKNMMWKKKDRYVILSLPSLRNICYCQATKWGEVTSL